MVTYSQFPLNILHVNRNHLGTKVKNMVIFSNDDFVIMAVFGPNNRLDYHINEKEVNLYVNSVLTHIGMFLPD
jgi:hypothetical protein